MQTFLVLLVAFVAGIEGILDEFEFHQPQKIHQDLLSQG